AVFSFGPVADIAGYKGGIQFPFDLANRQEVELRSPIHWLRSIETPTFAFEGEGIGGVSNIASLRAMNKALPSSATVQFFSIKGNHFSILSPTNRLIAEKILHDTGT